MTERFLRGGHRVIAHDRSPAAIQRKDYVENSGEGRWTVEEALERNVPALVLMLSDFARFASRQESSFSAKIIAALRNEFGGHAVKKE
jgi:6-phosphogluconate dehydrogenase